MMKWIERLFDRVIGWLGVPEPNIPNYEDADVTYPKDETFVINDMRIAPTHYVLFNGGGHFVKSAFLFEAQGGLNEEWGKRWRGVIAESIDDARDKSRKLDWDYCHFYLPRDQWCDKDGPGGFMGHTCKPRRFIR